MGQRANSGRNATLNDKKERAAGRQQNSPSRQAITRRQHSQPVPGAFGKEGKANRGGGVGSFLTGDTSGNRGGPADERMGRSTRPARKRGG